VHGNNDFTEVLKNLAR